MSVYEKIEALNVTLPALAPPVAALGKGAVLASVGIVAGVFFSASTNWLMAGLLYGVRQHDPEVFLGVPLLLLTVALLASYIPAWRATKVDPMVVLREA